MNRAREKHTKPKDSVIFFESRNKKMFFLILILGVGSDCDMSKFFQTIRTKSLWVAKSLRKATEPGL